MNSSAQAPQALLRLWSIYPLLVPFYLMGKTPVAGTEKVEGGVPQLADYFLVGLMALVFTTLPLRLGRTARVVAALLVCFVGYTALVNAAWAAGLEDLSLLKSTLYYAYDALLFITCLMLYTTFRERFLEVTVKAVGVSVVVQALLSPLAPQQTYARQAAFFNNENQLGYFCVLATTIFVLGARRFAIRLGYQVVFYVAAAYLTFLSQSRGALLSLGVLMIIALLGRPVRLLMALGVVGMIALVLTLTPPLVSKSEERLVMAGEYDTLATRGYDRILNYPELVLFGAGEGAYDRFRSDLFATELHSSFGTLLFCYGIPGTALFALALLYTARRDAQVALFLIPPLVHGIAHQGLRFAFFWLALGFLCCNALARSPEADSEASDFAPEMPQPGSTCEPAM
jgi:hypothetical protein